MYRTLAGAQGNGSWPDRILFARPYSGTGRVRKTDIVDLTGAGDLFASGFLHGYANNLSLKENLDKGTKMSSKIIQKIGARLS